MSTRIVPHALRLLTALAAVLAVLISVASTVSAGGWAVGSLDRVPDVEPGATVEVGFTVLQHGVTPAKLADGVGIEIRDVDGEHSYFAAVPGDRPGHYLAVVTFPERSGSYDWTIHMGWFGEQELEPLVVPSPAGLGASAWPAIAWIALAAVSLLAGAAFVGRASARRLRTSPAT